MIVTPFDDRSPSRSFLTAWLDFPGGRPPGDDKKEHAIAQLLEHGILSHAFGQHGEYKVRTTMTTRKTWQYRCSVLRHGKTAKRGFFPIIVEHKPPVPRGSIRPLGLEALRLSFAQEAVDVHFTRCAALREYLVMSALYDQPPKRSRGLYDQLPRRPRRWYALMIPLIGIAVVVAYGFWSHAFRIGSGQPSVNQSPIVAEQRPLETPKPVLLPSSNRTTSLDTENGQGETSPPVEPVETPKAVSVNELLGLQGPAEQARPTGRASSPGAATSDVQVGDMLHVTGWVQRISRAPDSSYHLYVSPNRQNGTQMMVATVPPPNQGQGSSAGQAQLQTVRTFIRQQLLRQQEPSLRGSVMQRPIFVQLTGQLSIPTVPPAVSSRGKGSQANRARWELRPLLEVQFATPSETSDRARAQ